MSAYYNEFDKYAAQWLRNLIAAGHIAPGDVDERSISDVRPSDLVGYTQCHFFAGIGGWSLALRLAGGLTTDPFGPAVAPASLQRRRPRSRDWLTSGTYGRIGSILYGPKDLQSSLVNRLMQRLPTGGSILFKMTWKAKVTPSGQSVSPAGVGAPHIRQRLWFVADSTTEANTHCYGADKTIQLKTYGAARLCDWADNWPEGTKANLVGWPTTTTRDWKDGSQCDNVPLNALLGRVAWLAEPWSTPRAKSVAGCSNIKDQVPTGPMRLALPRREVEAS